MEKIIIVCIALIAFSSCSHRIVRTGYETTKSNYTNCEVIIKKHFNVPDTLATKVGDIQLKDNGMSSGCSEEDALKILMGEACAIGADLIVIRDETRPDFLSSCYRCYADLYKLNIDRSEISLRSDEYYDNQTLIEYRVSKDRSKTVGIILLTAVVIFVIM